MSDHGDPSAAHPETRGDNVIRLKFRRRAMISGNRSASNAAAPFTLIAARGRWSLHCGPGAAPAESLSAEDLTAVADILREIARSLSDRVSETAGQPERRCIAEFVLHDDGGVDHWIAPSEIGRQGRARLTLGLRMALSSIRDK